MLLSKLLSSLDRGLRRSSSTCAVTVVSYLRGLGRSGFRRGLRPTGLPFVSIGLLAVVAVASACGGSSKAATASTTTTTVAGGRSGTFAAARTRFTSCLESKGVPANVAAEGFGAGRRGPSSSSSSSAPSTPRPTVPSQYLSAFQSCRSQLPSGFNSTQLRTYEQCLEVHGVPVPTTTPTNSGSTGGAPGGGFGRLGSLRSNPAYASAFQACASLLPARPGSSTSTTRPASS